MKFLDLNGLKHLLKFIDRTVSVAVSKCTLHQGYRMIPFITNHQIIIKDYGSNINLFNWFKGASEGGILEIVNTVAHGGWTYCINDENTSIIYKMEKVESITQLNRKNYIDTASNTYTRLIKLDGKLIVAEFV